MRRRQFIVAISALIPSAPIAFAQGRAPRIAFLSAGSAAGFATQLAGLRTGLKELGYAEGKNLRIEYRWAEGRVDRLPDLANELVRSNLDLIVTQGVPATRAAKAATTSVPIVMAAVGDAVMMGIVSSLAKPGGNITGLTFFAPELAAKRLELLKAAIPNLERVGYLFNPNNAIQRVIADKVKAAALALKVELELAEGRTLAEFENAIQAVASKGARTVMLSEEPIHLANGSKLIALAEKARMASAGPLELVSAGVTLAYGADFAQLYRRAAFFIDKILKGAKPAELPVEQATRFEFVINVRAASAVGISIPAPLVQRADRVLE